MHPDKGNTALAELLNDSADRMDDKIKVTANDVAAQKQAMKKTGAAQHQESQRANPHARSPAANRGRTAAAPAAARPAAPAATSASPVDLIDKTLDLASQAGGVGELKKLVDRLADMRRW